MFFFFIPNRVLTASSTRLESKKNSFELEKRLSFEHFQHEKIVEEHSHNTNASNIENSHNTNTSNIEHSHEIELHSLNIVTKVENRFPPTA